jgi:hypothetical protein
MRDLSLHILQAILYDHAEGIPIEVEVHIVLFHVLPIDRDDVRIVQQGMGRFEDMLRSLVLIPAGDCAGGALQINLVVQYLEGLPIKRALADLLEILELLQPNLTVLPRTQDSRGRLGPDLRGGKEPFGPSGTCP